MGKRKHLDGVEQLFDKSPVVSFASIGRIVRSKKRTGYAKLLVHTLIRRGRIRKLVKGCYTAQRDPALAVFCLQPAYLGLQAALSLHGMWEQETIPIILTCRKVRSGLRQVLGSNVLIRRTAPKYLFGWQYEQEGAWYFPYSDVEKTLIDLVVFREKLAPEVVKEMKKRIDMNKLRGYLKRYPAVMRKRVLGLLR